jgi:hypothetical protein
MTLPVRKPPASSCTLVSRERVAAEVIHERDARYSAKLGQRQASLIGAQNALPQDVLVGAEDDMDRRKPGGAQAGGYLLQTAADQNRLRRDQVLAGKAGQLLGRGHHERVTGRPVPES